MEHVLQQNITTLKTHIIGQPFASEVNISESTSITGKVHRLVLPT